jgi:hypothetical protein
VKVRATAIMAKPTFRSNSSLSVRSSFGQALDTYR